MTRLQLARSVAASAPSIAGITGVLLASPGYYRGTFSQICDGIYPGYYKGTATRVYDGIDPRYDQGTVSYVHDWSSLVANTGPARCMTAPTPAVTMIQLAWSITASTPVSLGYTSKNGVWDGLLNLFAALHGLRPLRPLWIYCPGHARVRGNERADTLASTADITSGLQLNTTKKPRGVKTRTLYLIKTYHSFSCCLA